MITKVGPPEANDPRIEIRETFMKPTPEWPEGGYLREVGGAVEMATGYFATIYPDKPSPYLGGKPPVVIMWNDGTREMGTFWWSKDADLDKLPEMKPAPIDPEVDRIDFYIKGSDGEYIPWHPTEAQKQMLTAFGLPKHVPVKANPR